MDLPTCPACGQSVLDDDPKVCPFCGASMTAKKGSKPTSPAGGAAPPKTAQKPATGKKKEIDPFAIEASTHKAVARVALRPAQGRTHAVKCPMCETEGFVPDAAAGKLVKCANASCMVPLFEAPPLAVEEPEPEPKKNNTPLVVVMLLLIIGGGAFGIYKTMFSGPDHKPLPRGDLTGLNPGNGNSGQPNGTNNGQNPGGKTTDPVKPEIDLAAFRKKLIERTMLDIATSRERNGKTNRSRQYCRQQISEAYARIGQIDNAIDQLDDIDKSNPELYFKDRLPPLVEIGWQQLAAGDRAALEATLKQAEKAGEETTFVSRSRFDRLSSLAALIAAAGDLENARHWTNVAKNVTNIADAQEFERVRQASSQITPFHDLPDYKFSTQIDNPLHKRSSPEEVTVALLLTGRGFDDLAVQWMKSLDERARSDSFLAYINWKASRNESSPDKVEQLLAGQPDVVQVRIMSAASFRLRENGNTAVADDFLSKATARADAILKGAELILPAPQLVADFQLPDPQPRLHAALSLWELARAQAAAGQSSEGWETLKQALALCRSIAPSPVALASRPHRDSDSGAEQIKQILAKEQKLTNDNAIRISFNRFTSKLNQLEDAAALRNLWITTLLDTAVEWGYEAQIWEEIRARLDETDVDRKERMIQHPLLIRVREKLETANNAAALEQIKSRLDKQQLALDPEKQFAIALDEMITKGEYGGMEQAAQTAQIDRDRIELLILDRMLKLLDKGQIDPCVKLIESLPDMLARKTSSGVRINDQLQLVREELYYILGRRAASLGKGPDLAGSFQKILPTPTEEISLLAGVAVGLKLPLPETETDAETESDDTKKAPASGSE